MNYLFWIFLLLLPTQLGKHWWPEWSLVDGARVDYLAPTVYLTDIILLSVAALVLFHNRRIFNFQKLKPYIPKFAAGVLAAGYLAFVILSSPRPWLAGYWVLRYLEILLAAWITVRSQKPEARSQIYRALAIGVLFSVGLGIIQMFLGRTTGWFWILGERSFTLADPGVATMTVWGREILRPYATFGHPNALAGFLAAGVFLMRGMRRKRRIRGAGWTGWAEATAVLGVFLSGSRGALAALAVAALLKVQSSKFKVQSLVIGLTVLLGLLGISGNLEGVIGFAGESGPERVVLARAATKMWRENWPMGVGPGQFLVKLPEYLPAGFYKIQPVHNVFLLGLAEFGVVGVIMGLMGLTSLMGQMEKIRLIRRLGVLAVILVTGMVDHYWLTAQQNRLLMGVILGFLVSGRR